MAQYNQLPFFVYGTLLPGQPNYYLWGESIIQRQVAALANGRLYDLGNYPMLLETGDDLVKGMMMTVRPSAYKTVLTRLDYLEGYFPDKPGESEYARLVREVQLEDGTAVTVWVYIGQVNHQLSLPIVPNGDWVTHAAHKQDNLETWWQHINSVAGLHNQAHDTKSPYSSP
ncbi:MAG: gamma-glutamylcyclotransferase [Chloroflexi bacterium]|nr:gamma-glutamylcyclotransferase [Chloroflexota bacterium]